MTDLQRYLLALSVIALPGVQACTDVFGKDCTLMPCQLSFVVEVSGTESTSVIVEVSEDDGESHSGSCEISKQGWCDVRFSGWIGPGEVTITVTDESDGVESMTVTPAFEVYHPNGPDCGPTCRRATIVVDLEPNLRPPSPSGRPFP